MFTIVTASFRQLNWLKLCAASVADQEGVHLEHIVQDGGLDPEVEEWGRSRPGLRVVMEKDSGMYDAINRGLRKGTGELCAYLNCDEQYLPGALKRVQEIFAARPEVDVLFGDAHVVDPEGRYMCTRGAVIPEAAHTQVSGNLAILTCSTFFRRRILQEHELYFDTQWRDLGDAAWVLELIRRGVGMGLCEFATSTFTDTGENMNLKPNGQLERERFALMAPVWARKAARLVTLHYRLRKLLAGHYAGGPLDYQIYTHASPHRRVPFHVKQRTAVWESRIEAGKAAGR